MSDETAAFIGSVVAATITVFLGAFLLKTSLGIAGVPAGYLNCVLAVVTIRTILGRA